MNSPSLVSHEHIARRAHQIWEETGRPEGSCEENWLQAEREILARHGTTFEVDAKPARSVEPPITGHPHPERPRHSTDYNHPGVTTDTLHHVRDR